MNYKELFINKDDVLLIRKELVRILGDLNEAVVLNQLNYWIEINKKAEKNLRDGKYWIFNTYQTWRETDFDFWSTDTIRRTLTRLENKGIVLSANYNKLKIDKTKWYTIDYEKLQKLIDEHEKKQIANKENAYCVHDMANCTDENGNISKAIPENTTDNTNKDYIKENTKGETLSKDNGEADTSFPKKRLPAPDKKKTKEELKKLEIDMFKRFCIIGSLYDTSEMAYENIIRAFRRYLNRYTKQTGKVHPILKDETLENIFVTLATISDTEYNHFDNVADYEPDDNGLSYLDKMVDEYFKSEHSDNTDWHISHFARQEYLEKMAQHIVNY